MNEMSSLLRSLVLLLLCTPALALRLKRQSICAAGLMATCLLLPVSALPTPAVAAVQQDKSFRQLMSEGSEAFERNEIDKSVAAFRAAEEKNPSMSPYLWQKGIAEYAAGDYEACARQFKADLTVPAHAADSEESIFYLACEARAQAQRGSGSGSSSTPDASAAYQQALQSLPSQRVRDRREIMNAIFAVFAQKQPPTSLAPSASQTPQQTYYALFYRGFYAEVAAGDAAEAQRLYGEALQTPYARSASDFMVTVCKVFSARK